MEQTNTKISPLKKPGVQSAVGIIAIFAMLGGYMFWYSNKNTILIENSHIEAPIISLSGSTSGTLNTLYVKEGQVIQTNTPVALVGTNIVTSKESGIILNTKNNIGEFFNPGQTVVSMIHPEDMRVIGTIDENKGLDEIHAGQKVTFTIDTFGNKIYAGEIESISNTSNDTGVLFSISDKRPTKKFDVKVVFNTKDYPEIKNGMSAKITVYTK